MAHAAGVCVCAGLFRGRVGTATVEGNGVSRAKNTNEEIQMTKEIQRTNGQSSKRARSVSSFIISYVLAALLFGAFTLISRAEDHPTVLLVVGAAGEEEFGKNFEKWAGLGEKASREAGANIVTVGFRTAKETNDLEHLKGALQKEPKDSMAELWLVLIGHWTYDGKEAKFNLRGPDLSATELASLLQPFHRPLAV